MGSIFEICDRAFVINAEQEIQRLESAQCEFARIGIEVERFPAITPNTKSRYLRPGAIGSNLSHCGVVQLAKKRGYRNVLIFEDDVVFRSDFIVRWGQVVDQVAQLNYDLFYFYNWRTHEVGGEQKLLKIVGTLCVHAYVVSACFYDKFIERIMKECTERIIDQILLTTDATKWATVPNLVGQNGGISTITNRPAVLRWSAKDRWIGGLLHRRKRLLNEVRIS